jgi:prevent-host-death family protein
MSEVRVGTRELKSRLSEYLRLVKGGQTIIVTERGRAIGQISPLGATIEERLQAMLSAGTVEWNGQQIAPYRPTAVNRGARQLSDLVVEGRD